MNRWRWVVLALVPLGCGESPPPTCGGETLFGAPNASTGLGADACGTTCECGGDPWTPPSYPAADRAELRTWRLAEPFAALAADPYAADVPAPATGDDPVCALLPEGDHTYRLATFPTPQEATRAGGQLTHFGGCGVCSTLDDLAVYMEQPDLTEPVRACGLANLAAPVEDLVTCIEAIGFTHPCAQVWAYNTLHTRDLCGAVCLASLDAPYNNADGSINDCLQCDEDASGPVFKAVAGRTRRNTGLPSSMCRPCSEVRPVEHFYSSPE